MNRICVFCGSRAGSRPIYADAAQALAQSLLRRGIGLVYGGGCVGLMGTIATAMMRGGGKVIGVIPEALVERELAFGDVTELIVVRSMHERKAKMAELNISGKGETGKFTGILMKELKGKADGGDVKAVVDNLLS